MLAFLMTLFLPLFLPSIQDQLALCLARGLVWRLGLG